ncbi:MAG: FMN-binding protein [Dehalococcoidia bacterium]
MNERPGQPPRPASGNRKTNRWLDEQGRLKGTMAGLSAAAILAVYAAGYLRTEADGTSTVVPAQPAATETASPATQAPATQTARPTTTPVASASVATPRATATATATAVASTTKVTYADGTYSGSGSSRHGGMSVEVVVQGGKIVSAEITQCGTRYPCSRISQLPARVIAAQSAKVDYVSGATDSSVAFASAVAQALAQAQVKS